MGQPPQLACRKYGSAAMSAPLVQGWCPGALRPMESGDGWVVRVRPRAGLLTAAQAAGIAALAAVHGNGLIDLSARANVQLRGVSIASHTPLIKGLRALNLIDASTDAESQRNVTLSPFWGDADHARQIALDLSDALTAPTAPRLPGKFGFAVDMGAVPVLRGTAADIRLEALGDDVLIYAMGAQAGAKASPAQAVHMALDLAEWFVSSGGIGPDGRGRMAGHLAGHLAGGAVLPARFLAHPIPPAPPYAPRIGLYPQGALVGFEFGQMTAQNLADLAAFGALRITPWRMVLVEGVQTLPDIQGIITNPNDPALRVIACTGAPACHQGLQPTRDLGRALSPHLPQGQVLHISGCAKGCAHPSPADWALTGTAAGFDLVRGGLAGDTPDQTALNAAQIQKVLNAP